MKLSIILPMFNEEKRIVDTLEKIDNYFRDNDYNYNVIIIDDGSTDNSYNEVFNYIYHNNNNKISIYKNTKNKGKGFSVRRGLMIGDSDYYLMMDVDLSTPIEEIVTLLKNIKLYDVVIGSRYVKYSTVIIEQSLLRRFYSRVFNFLVNFLFELDVCDTQCGFKLYSRKARNLIVSKSIIVGFSFDVEHIFICKENGIKYYECGVIWSDNKPRSFNIKKIFDMFTEIMLIHRIKIKKGYKVIKNTSNKI